MNDDNIKIKHWAIIVTGLLAFALSLIWYSPLLFGKIWKTLRSSSVSSTPEWTMIFAPLREIIAGYILAYFIVRLSLKDWKSAVRLSFMLWVAFYVVSLAGAVLWDNMPWQLGAVHAGDWFMKMMFMALVLSYWHSKKSHN